MEHPIQEKNINIVEAFSFQLPEKLNIFVRLLQIFKNIFHTKSLYLYWKIRYLAESFELYSLNRLFLRYWASTWKKLLCLLIILMTKISLGTKAKIFFIRTYQIFYLLNKEFVSNMYHSKISFTQDWVAFMSQPYWVEVMVEVELRLMLIWTWGWN